MRIGKRATLVKAPGSIAWGMVYSLTPDDLAVLYGAPGFEVYKADRSRSRSRTAPSFPPASTTCRARRPPTNAIRSTRRS